MGNCIKSAPSQAAVISGVHGTRMVIGRSAWMCHCIESVEILDLELLTLEVKSVEAETVRGVRVSVNSICQVKVDAYETVGDADHGAGTGISVAGGEGAAGDGRVLNRKAMSLACQHFLGRNKAEITSAILCTLEGHQREILGTLTVEELYKDRAAFSERVREHIFADISAIGFVLVSYTVTKIFDAHGYMEALGATQTALVMREAAEGRARNEAESTKATSLSLSMAKTAEAENQAIAHINVAEQKQLEALANRNLSLKEAEYRSEVNTADAKAEAAKMIEAAKQQQQVIKEQTTQRVVETQMLLEYEDAEALRKQKQLEGAAKAKLLEDENRAKGIRITAEADADRVRKIGMAEAEVIIAKGEAEAKVLELRAGAFAKYGEAAIMNDIVGKLPEIAKAMAAPLSKTEKMVFISSDGGAGSKLTQDVSTMMAQLGPAVQSVTGFDLNKGLARLAGSTGLEASNAAPTGVRAR